MNFWNYNKIFASKYDKLSQLLKNYDADGRHLGFFPKGYRGHFGQNFKSAQNTLYHLVYRQNDSTIYKISILDTFIVFTKGLYIHKLATNNYI